MSVPNTGSPTMPVPVRAARSRRARALALLVGVVAGLFGVFAFPAGAAQAHAALIRTVPAQGSIVLTAPSEIVITFSEVVQPVPSRITVISPEGKRIESGPPRVVGDDMHIPVRTDVPGGTYLVSYRVISADSHPVGGGFTYSVGAPSPGGAPTPINGGATDRVVAVGVSAMQFVGFVGLILLLGPTMVLIALWPRRLDRRQPIRLVYSGIGLVGFASVVGLYLQAPYESGGSLFSVTGADLSDVFDSHFGQAYLIRLALLVIIGFLLRPVLAGRGGKAEHVLLAVLGAIGIGTWAYAGHAGGTDVAPLTVVADVAHLASVGIWLGGLVMLAAFLLRRANVRELGAILPVWSNWAMLAVTVLVLSGTSQALIEIGTIHALLYTTYGQLVIAKVLLLAVILAFAQGARLLVQRHAGVPEALMADAHASGTADARASVATRVAALAGADRGVRARIGRSGGGSRGAGAGDGADADDDGAYGYDDADYRYAAADYDVDGFDGRSLDADDVDAEALYNDGLEDDSDEDGFDDDAFDDRLGFDDEDLDDEDLDDQDLDDDADDSLGDDDGVGDDRSGRGAAGGVVDDPYGRVDDGDDDAYDGDDDAYDGDDVADDGDDDADDGGPRPRGLDRGVLRRLRRSVLAEIVVAVLVLVATSALVQSSPGRTADADAALNAASSGLVTLNSSLYSLQVDFTQSGTNTEIHLYAANLQGAPIKIQQWTVDASLPSQNLGPIPAAVTAITDSHAIGEISLTVPGTWTFTFTLRTSDIDEATVQTTVPIR
ncbi:MAG TPA: copper resistance protein CopC [Micromonosporaceae bacterium]|nr:copper resistance protein CopC [Micromonosporaceae bacterium]